MLCQIFPADFDPCMYKYVYLSEGKEPLKEEHNCSDLWGIQHQVIKVYPTDAYNLFISCILILNMYPGQLLPDQHVQYG